MKQNEILKPTPLLDEEGNVKNPGFCRKNYYEYDRNAVKANALRIKEWDFYQFSNDRYVLQITVADISMGGASSIGVFDMKTGKRADFMNLSLLTLGKLGLASNTEMPHTLADKRGDYSLKIDATSDKQRTFTAIKPGVLEINLTARRFSEHESLVMAVPFDKKGYFYLNQKMNSMPVSGTVKVKDIEFEFNEENSFCVLDWGRGVWPYKVSWYWGNGTHRLEDGRIFGFEIGWGFGDMSAASENMLFINGKGHKIGNISHKKSESSWLGEWVFTTDDGRFNLTMTPFYDNYTSSRVLGVIGNQCHQVFGKWNGTAVLDDGEVLQINDMVAFCEFSDNRW